MTDTSVVQEGLPGFRRGQLPSLCYGVRLVGRATVTNPSGAGLEHHIADVAAHGDHAFLMAYREPTCERTGAYVVDISDPAAPFEVESAFMETTPGNYVGEGPTVIELDNEHFTGPVLVHGNEIYAQAHAPDPTGPRQRGGFSLWDVRDAEHPELLVAHAGDYTGDDGEPVDQAVEVLYTCAWTDGRTGRTYAGLVTVKPTTDIVVADISDPRHPELVNAIDLRTAPFDVTQDVERGLTSLFAHTLSVRRVGDRHVMAATFWDGGYVLLDVTDPTPGHIALIARSTYPEFDEERRRHGQLIAPEGNAEHCDLAHDGAYLVGADQAFDPYRLVGTITAGPHAGTGFVAAWSPDTGPVDPAAGLSGTPTYVGSGCPGTVAPGRGIALVERDRSILTAGSAAGCSFQEKLDTVVAAGYDACIFFNHEGPDALQQFPTSARGPIPTMFVNRLTGLQLLGVPDVTAGNAGTTATPAVPVGSATTVESVFSGWGFLRLFRTDVPGSAEAGALTQIDTYALPESQDPDFAYGFGDLSASHVAIDPRRRLVYATFFTGGLRVLRYGEDGLHEVGAYCVPGIDFSGVRVHTIGGQDHILVTDRNFGLYVFAH